MKAYARAVVVGGGVVGCSVLYHLTQKGWSDVVLCERNELTAGSTWHAIGHVILYTLNDTISRLNQYGVDLYKQLEHKTGQNPGFHVCGNLRLATHPDRLNEFKRYLSVARAAGVRVEMLGPDEIREIWPLMQTDGVLAGVYNPEDGHISPADLTQALAAGARHGGAQIYRQTEVTALQQRPGGGWLVKTNQGEIICEHVISCSGNHTRQTLALVGLDAQSVPVRHQFIVTGDIPALVERRAAGLPELPVMRDPEGSFYVRQEGVGLAMGCYEEKGTTVFVDEVPPDFSFQLFPDDLDPLLPYLEKAAQRVPDLEIAGIKNVVNGPMPYTPDDMPTVGPAFGLRNFWLAEGNPFGITLAGGIGWQMAEWIVEGEPGIDMWPCDSRRYGEFATRKYSALKTEEAYEHTYLLPKPEEELPAGRPLKTSPIHDLLAARGAVFGAVYGWERPNWFAPDGVEPRDNCSFRRPNYFNHVGEECRRARSGAGIADVSHAARFLVSGFGAAQMLEGILCTRLPEEGRTAAGYALTAEGMVRSEFSVMHEAADRFLLISAAAAERYDLDLLLKNLPGDASVRLDNLTGSEAALTVSGPKARELLSRVTESDLSEKAFPPGTVQNITAGLAPARAVRLALSDWCIHSRSEYLRHIFLALEEAGKNLQTTLYGARAENSLRLEKAIPGWGSDLIRSFSACAAGLQGIIDFSRTSFRGRQALLDELERGVRHRLVCLEVFGNDDFDARGAEPIRVKGGKVVGRTTSGGYGHCTARSLAMGYVDAGHADAKLEIFLMGDWYKAKEVEHG